MASRRKAPRTPMPTGRFYALLVWSLLVIIIVAGLVMELVK